MFNKDLMSLYFCCFCELFSCDVEIEDFIVSADEFIDWFDNELTLFRLFDLSSNCWIVNSLKFLISLPKIYLEN